MSELEDITAHFLAAKPELPPFSERMFRHAWMSRSNPSLLIVPRHQRHAILSAEIEEEFMCQWFSHSIFGGVSYAYWVVFHMCTPICFRNTFSALNFRYLGNRIESIDLICTKCLNVTYVDSTWFDSLFKDIDVLLCCHKKFTYKNVWKTLFWGMSFYNTLLYPLSQLGHRIALIPSKDATWGEGSRVEGRLVRSFSQGTLRERDNGEWLERCDSVAKIGVYLRNTDA